MSGNSLRFFQKYNIKRLSTFDHQNLTGSSLSLRGHLCGLIRKILGALPKYHIYEFWMDGQALNLKLSATAVAIQTEVWLSLTFECYRSEVKNHLIWNTVSQIISVQISFHKYYPFLISLFRFTY